MRSAWGPAEFHPREWTNNTGGGGTPIADTLYDDPIDGLFHWRLEGGARDILLMHWDNKIWVHNGSEKGWDILIDASSISALWNDDLSDLSGSRPRFLTQFVGTPDGIIIVLQGEHRVFFYDGEKVLPLGYTFGPGAPTPVTPEPTFEDGIHNPVKQDTANTGGYYHSGRNMNEVMGVARLGTLRTDVVDIESGTGLKKSNNLGGVLEVGQWRCAYQWIDAFGNLSPISAISSPVSVVSENNLTKERRKDEDERVDRLRIQCAWTGIEPGPTGTIGRLVLRTRDEENSGIPGLFILPNYSSASPLGFATMPDNVCTLLPDNIPDSWLISRPTEVKPFPSRVQAAARFDGRAWYAANGIVEASYPGRWGMIDPAQSFYPDADAGDITGFAVTARGMLVFTESTCTLVMRSDDGSAYIINTLSSDVGCVSPNSIGILKNGVAIWLGREGFYAWGGEGIPTIISTARAETIERINSAWRLRSVAAVDPRTQEYRCWIPVDCSEYNNLCMVFNGRFWLDIDYIKARAVTVTNDWRDMMLVAGEARAINTETNTVSDIVSLWALDHEARGVHEPAAAKDANNNPIQRSATIETSWLKMGRSWRRSTPRRAYLWFRETANSNVTVDFYRDGRDSYPVHTDTVVRKVPDDNEPQFWGTAQYNGTYSDKMYRDRRGKPKSFDISWQKRRAYWTKVEIDLEDVETFKLKIEGTGDWEFVGMVFSEDGAFKGGVNIPGKS